MPVTRQTQSDTSPASETIAAGTPITGLDDFDSVVIFASIVGATGGVLDVFVQAFDGVNWIDIAHFTQLADGGAAVQYIVPISRVPRPDDNTAVVTGQDLTPALAADTIVHGTLTDRLRFVFDAGAGTSAGASQTLTIVGTKTLQADSEKRLLDLTSPAG